MVSTPDHHARLPLKTQFLLVFSGTRIRNDTRPMTVLRGGVADCLGPLFEPEHDGSCNGQGERHRRPASNFIRKGSAKLLASIDAILGSIQVLAFDIPADTAYGGIRAALEAAGKPIGANDLLIAAHACSVGAILISANTGEFSRVRGLQVENWVSPLQR